MEDYKIWEKFKVEKRLVKEFKHWLVVVRGKQVTLGACVFLLKRGASGLGELTVSEAEEFVKSVSWYEEKVKSVFGAERFNYVVAMMKDPYVHYHAFPRYSKQVEMYNETWIDEAWPKVIEFKDVEVSEEVLASIKAALSD